MISYIPRNEQVVLAIHSHLSRQFVSNFVGFFTMYGVFLIYFWNVLLPRAVVGNDYLLILGVVVTLAAASGFLLRTVGFGAALDTIETKYLILATRSNRIISSHQWFREELLGPTKKKTYFLVRWFDVHRQFSEYLAWGVIVLSALGSLWLIMSHG